MCVEHCYEATIYFICARSKAHINCCYFEWLDENPHNIAFTNDFHLLVDSVTMTII